MEMTGQELKGNLMKRVQEEQDSKKFRSATNFKISLCSPYGCLKKLDTTKHHCEFILSCIKSLHSCSRKTQGKKTTGTVNFNEIIISYMYSYNRGKNQLQKGCKHNSGCGETVTGTGLDHSISAILLIF